MTVWIHMIGFEAMEMGPCICCGHTGPEPSISVSMSQQASWCGFELILSKISVKAVPNGLQRCSK